MGRFAIFFCTNKMSECIFGTILSNYRSRLLEGAYPRALWLRQCESSPSPVSDSRTRADNEGFETVACVVLAQSHTAVSSVIVVWHPDGQTGAFATAMPKTGHLRIRIESYADAL